MRSAHGSPNHQTPNPEDADAKEGASPNQRHRAARLDYRIFATAMEMASSSAPTTSYYNVNMSVAQAVLTVSINVIIVWLTTVIKSSSSSSSSGRRNEAAPAPTATSTAPPPSPSPAKPAAAAVDMDVVLGLMGADAGAVSVGFEEAAALFEDEEATVEEAREAFAVFDRNGDGFIDAAELRSVLTSLGFESGVAQAECQRMIDAYDGDRDGRIDFHEFVKLMETSQ